MTSLIAGPSLATRDLSRPGSQKRLYPFAPTLGQYITAADATARYTNRRLVYRHGICGLAPVRTTWIKSSRSKGRFHSNASPLTRPATAGRLWAAMLATAAVDGLASCRWHGCTFDVTITFNNKPYLNSDIDTWLLVFDDRRCDAQAMLRP